MVEDIIPSTTIIATRSRTATVPQHRLSEVSMMLRLKSGAEPGNKLQNVTKDLWMAQPFISIATPGLGLRARRYFDSAAGGQFRYHPTAIPDPAQNLA